MREAKVDFRSLHKMAHLILSVLFVLSSSIILITGFSVDDPTPRALAFWSVFLLASIYRTFNAYREWIIKKSPSGLKERALIKLALQKKPDVDAVNEMIASKMKLAERSTAYFIFHGRVEIAHYTGEAMWVQVAWRNGKVVQIISGTRM